MKIYNILHCYQRTEPRLQVTYTAGNMYKPMLKYMDMFLEICKQTDRQTDMLITILGSPTRVK